MIIKSIGRKGSSAIGGVLSYIAREDATVRDAKGNPLIYTHNLQGKTFKQLEVQLLAVEANRKHKRANSNACLHQMLSFSPEDTAKLTPETLEDLAREYIRLYNENAAAVFTLHDDTRARHIHMLLSGVEVITGTSIRISKDKFGAIKEELQAYQQQRYPELVSVVEHGKGEALGMGDAEYDETGSRLIQISRR